MLWLQLALMAALCSAGNDALTKRFFSDLSAFEMGFVRLLYAFPYLIIGLFLIPWPKLDCTFWVCIAVGLPLELAALMSYMRAIKVSPLSLTVPFLAFTPVFVIITGYLLLGEVLNLFGILGISLIVIGSYVLNISHGKYGWFSPFKAIFLEQGSWLMLITSFLYSFTATLGKLAIIHSSPQFFGAVYFILFTLFLICLFPFMSKGKLFNLFKMPIPGIISGLLVVGMIFSHTLAISLVEAAYMLSVKRTSLLIGVLFGAIFFKEEKIRERLLGTVIMMAGVVIIGIFG
ncbi:EamA family transporter [Thermodesulfobacteriota bacterium]